MEDPGLSQVLLVWYFFFFYLKCMWVYAVGLCCHVYIPTLFLVNEL